MRSRLRHLVAGAMFVLSLTAMAGPQVVMAQTKPQPEAAVPSKNPAAPVLGVETPAYLDQVVNSAEYVVGPGDRLFINVWGERPEHLEVTITPEATLIVPAVGEIDVRGLRLDSVKAAVQGMMTPLYPRARLSVTLAEVRRFRVTVTGEVETPGLHIVTANTRASEVLDAAGLKDEAARRQVRLQRSDTTVMVDLAAFERLGLRQANPYLAEGDVLIVPPHDPRWGTVEVSGSVRAPGRFGYSPGDLVGDLIDLAFGLAPDADTTLIELWRFFPGENQARRLDWPPQSSYSQWRQVMLLPDDRLLVRGIEEYRPKRAVTVTGEVARPGTYVFSAETISLRAVIDSAGGFTPWADLSHALIVRPSLPVWMQENRDRLTQLPSDLRARSESDWLLAEALSYPGRVATDFVRLFNQGDESFNVPLVDGDRVLVPRLTEGINVIGRVVQPGMVPHRLGADLTYYLNRAGGYSSQADRGGTFLVKGTTGAAIKKRRIGEITAGDTIVVPTRRGRNWWTAFRETLTVATGLATMYLVIDQATN